MTPALQAWRKAGQIISLPQNGYSLFTRDLGDTAASSEQTVLLLHGFPESSYSYHKVVDGLLVQFERVVLFDMLGYGFSDKPNSGYSYSLIQQADMALLLWQQLGIRGGHIICHDMGTSVLTELAARQASDLLPRWFSAGFHSFTFTNGSMVLKFAKLRLVQKLLLSRVGPSVGKLLSYKSFHASVLSAHGVSNNPQAELTESDISDLWESVQVNGGRYINHLLIHYINDRKRFEETRWLPALSAVADKTPVHFCWGDADQVARIEMVHYLIQSVCPAATLSVMPNVGHFCQLGSPEIWLEKICNFYLELKS